MSLIPLLLLGAGGHARACVDVIEQEGRYVIVGLTGIESEVGTSVLGYPVLATDADLPALLKTSAALVTVGQIKSPNLRISLFETIRKSGCEMPCIVSPKAYVSRHALVGAGSIVMHGAIVNAGAAVGRNCIINSHALVEHDVQISDHSHISTHAAINSGVRVGVGTFIGSGTIVRQQIGIGERCVIGMGQRVVKDCKDGTWIPPIASRA